MKKVDYAEIGARIRDVRIMQRLTQEEAAERCDITSSYYGNIERGDKKMSVETLIKISKGLGISADGLLFADSEVRRDMISKTLEEIQGKVDEKQFEKYLSIMGAIATIVDKL